MDAKIRKYIDYCRSLLLEVTDEELVSEDGDIIFYMNGNDSTSFDYGVNSGPCGESGYTNTFLHKNGSECLWVTVNFRNKKVYFYNEFEQNIGAHSPSSTK